MSIQGKVGWVSFQPGRNDGLLELRLGNELFLANLIINDPEAQITVDGENLPNADYGRLSMLLDYLIKTKCSVTVYPRSDRYGFCTQAEFVSEKAT